MGTMRQTLRALRTTWRPIALRRLAGTAIALSSLVGASASHAIGAVGFKNWDGGFATVTVAPGDDAAATGIAGLASSMANNPALNGSAWAHTGAWWNVLLDASPLVTLRVQAQDPGQFSPGVSVWASGASVFDGGTTGQGGETSTAGFGTPHSFNAYGPLGASGTLWMQDGVGGNMKELLGYAISGPSFLGMTGWGETIATGAHDVRLTNDFATAVAGSVGAGYAELVLSQVAAGWYTIYVGGTQHGLSGGLYDLSVASVPEPSTALLVGVGLVAMTGARRILGTSRAPLG